MVKYLPHEYIDASLGLTPRPLNSNGRAGLHYTPREKEQTPVCFISISKRSYLQDLPQLTKLIKKGNICKQWSAVL